MLWVILTVGSEFNSGNSLRLTVLLGTPSSTRKFFNSSTFYSNTHILSSVSFCTCTLVGPPVTDTGRPSSSTLPQASNTRNLSSRTTTGRSEEPRPDFYITSLDCVRKFRHCLFLHLTPLILVLGNFINLSIYQFLRLKTKQEFVKIKIYCKIRIDYVPQGP